METNMPLPVESYRMYVANTVERYLPTMRPRVRGKELFSEHDRLRDQLSFFLKGPAGNVAPVLLNLHRGFQDTSERDWIRQILDAVELAAWTLDLHHDVVAGVAGRWRHFGRSTR